MTPLLATLALLGDALVNGDFEASPAAAGEIPGWQWIVGATQGGDSPISEVALSAEAARGGERGVQLSGDANTRLWRLLYQDVDARPGAACTLRGWARADGLRLDDGQRSNAYAGLMAFDVDGNRLAFQVDDVRRHGPDGRPFEVRVEVPEEATTVRAMLFLSQTGVLGFDDIELAQVGGRALPRERVCDETFDDAASLEAWETSLGATLGDAGPRSSTAHDPDVGGGSLAMRGDASVVLWEQRTRTFPTRPGDRLRLDGRVRAADVAREGGQFANLHARLEFLDAAGQRLGAPRFANRSPGSFDWSPFRVEAVAPAGTSAVRVGLFLSMTGTAWFDDLTLDRFPGAPPYAGWIAHAGEHVELRCHPEHPFASGLAAYAERLDAAYERIRDALDVAFDEPITAYLYRDDERAQAMLGRTLNFAEPRLRAVHMRPSATLGHELCHVLATAWGDAGSALLGEGLAVWLDGRGAEHHHERARALLAEGDLPTPLELATRFGGDANAYAAAGSFVGWLWAEHGRDAVRALYLSRTLPETARAELDSDLDQLGRAWVAFLEGDRGAEAPR